MSRHYREHLGEHVVSETVYSRPPYTVATVLTEWQSGDEIQHIWGVGVAKYNSRDAEAGVPYDAKRGETIALGRAYRDAWEQRHPTSWRMALANSMVDAIHEMGRAFLSVEKIREEEG